jgi:hypothetical protein
MKRYTFVIQVHPDGISTLENLSTHERVRIVELASVGEQIELWMNGQAESQETNFRAAPAFQSPDTRSGGISCQGRSC